MQEIKTAIEQLSLEERAVLLRQGDYGGQAAHDRDRQVRADAAAGKFARLNYPVAERLCATRVRP